MKMCEFIIYVENLLNISATFSDHLQGGDVRRMSYKDLTINV